MGSRAGRPERRDAPEREPVDPRRRHRPWSLLLLLVIFGLPFAVVTQLLRREHPTVGFGEQPGGEIAGVVLGPGGDPVSGHAIELRLVSRDLTVAPHSRARTDAAGRFVLDAPPFSGKYLLAYGGGPHRAAFREVSLVESAEAARDVELALVEGAILRLSFTRADGRPVTGGRAVVEAVTSDGPLFGWMGFPLSREVEFEGAACEVDGLPPCEGEVQVLFTSGDVLKASFEAPLGSTELAFEL